MKGVGKHLIFVVLLMILTSLACQVGGIPNTSNVNIPPIEQSTTETESTTPPEQANVTSSASGITPEMDVMWQNGELILYTRSDWGLVEMEPTDEQLLSQWAGLDRIDLSGAGIEIHALYANSYDTAYATVFAPIQFLIADGAGIIEEQSTFTLNNRLMAFWKIQQGNRTGFMYAVQVESGEAVSLITWVSTDDLDDYHETITVMAANADTIRAEAARAAGPAITQPENTHLAYAQTATSSLSGELIQEWTWDGQAGEIVRITVADGTAPIQLTILDPSRAAMAYTPSLTPFDSDPIVLPATGRYTLHLKTNEGLNSNYSLQIVLVTGSEVPLGQLTEIPYSEDAPYFVFWGEAGRAARIVASANERPVGVTFYATSFAQWRHGSIGEIRVRLPYTGPYLVKIYEVPEGNQTVSVLVEQGEAENLDGLVTQQQLLDETQELKMPITAELIPGETFPAVNRTRGLIFS